MPNSLRCDLLISNPSVTAFIIFAKVPFYFRKMAFITDYYCLLQDAPDFETEHTSIPFIIKI